MSRVALVALALLAVPVVTEAQVDVGMDSGLTISGLFQTGDNISAFRVPSGSLRLGFPSEGMVFETLASFTIVRAGGTSATALSLIPGLNFALDESGTYARAEIGFLATAGGGNNDLELGLGGAVGMKKPIEEGPFSYRLELGFHRWMGDLDVNELRALVGLSVTVG